MKKFTFLAFTVILFLSLSSSLFAQQVIQEKQAASSNTINQRCGTTEWLNNMIREYPGFKEQYEESERMLGRAVDRYLAEQRANPNRVNVPMVIPIVFHVVLSNQAAVPDAMITAQLNVLNADYAGLNPDSTNIPAQFQAIRGHSDIQFCMAQRTPTNAPTNGINRVTSGTLSNGSSTNDPIKNSAAGGADAWDPTRYFNVWVGNFTGGGLLGYASFPIGSPENPGGNISQQGVVVLAASLPGGTAIPFNLGRTLVHEAGHFFWLRHINGDAACGDDFPTTPALDDTPTQSNLTSGCPTGNQATGCTSPNPPGRMYQNYMDYTDDACYSMFTNGQNARSYQAVNTFRPTLLTSNGCTPPVVVANNASISAFVTPGLNFVTCDPTIPVTVTLRNAGNNALTSVTITVRRNATVVQTLNWTGNLAPNATVNVPLNAVALANGANAIEVCTSLPNGVPDGDPSDDCRTQNGIRGAGTPLPLVEGFEGATFPPVGWTRVNPDNNITWQRSTAGVSHTGIGKAFVDHASYGAAGQTDDLNSPNLAIGQADSLWVSMWGAYKGWPGFPFEFLQIRVSTNCGGSYTLVKEFRNDTAFGVAPLTQAGTFIPSNINQWRQKSVDLSQFIPAGSIQVQFRAVNQFGNNMYLDDININKAIFWDYDAGVLSINKPQDRICTNSLAPEVTIKNFGKITLTSVKINYQLDAAGPITTFNWTGSLVRNQTAVVTLPIANLGTTGNHTIRVWTSEPNAQVDQEPANDSQTKPYIIRTVLDMPGQVIEDFTNPTFPPPNWEVINPNGDMTWQRNASVGRNAPGSAWFNDYVNNTTNRWDDLAMPNYRYSGIDSIFLTFNLAHVTRKLPGTTGALLDTFSVLISKDCGNTFQTVYKKWGEDLQTVNDPNFQSTMLPFTPKTNEWRTDSINLGRWLGSSESSFQVIYRFSGNFENNFYLDDINLRTQILPTKLKTQGYLVLPNPFQTTFGVWHYQQPTNLRYITVYNSVGQLVWSQRYPSGAEKYIQIDLSNRSAGVYHVNLGYDDTNRNTTVPIVKY